MKTFDDFKLEQETHEIATLICDLGIDPDAYLEAAFKHLQVLEEGIFKKMGDWWKKNVSAPNTVRLQSSYDQAKQGVDNFIKNMMSLRKQGHSGSNIGSGLYQALRQIKQNLTGMKDQVAKMDQGAQQSVANTPYGDIGNWDGSPHPSMGQMAHKGGEMAKQGAAYMGQKFGDWKNQQNWNRLSPFEKGLKRMKNRTESPTDI